MLEWGIFFRRTGFWIALGTLALIHGESPVRAQGQSTVSVTHQVNYIAAQRNPWGPGSAPEYGEEVSIGPPRFDVALPTTGITPYQLLANFFGLSLPDIGFVEVGGNMRGRASLNLGYRVSGGSLDINYPAQVQLTMQRADPVRAEVEVIVDTRFTAGRRRQVAMPRIPHCPGDDSRFLPCRLSERVLDLVEIGDEPRFSTSFPTASAHVTFEYDFEAGAFLAAGVARAGAVCFLCFRTSYRMPRQGRHDLVRISPGGIEIAGLDPIPLFDQTIPVGPGSITVSYPRLEAGNVRRASNGTSLVAEDVRPLIQFSGALDKLFPFIGPFLTNDIGPIGYSLMELSAGPRLSLYQDFRLDVAPRVTLHFSRPVLHRVGSRWNETQVIGPVPIGQQIRWRAPMTHSGPIQVQPVYELGARFRNRTGLSLGYQINMGGLRITAGGLGAGPIPLGRFNDDPARLELCCRNDFEVGFDPIRPAPIELQVQVGATNLTEALVGSGGHVVQRSPDAGSAAGSVGDRLPDNLAGQRQTLVRPSGTQGDSSRIETRIPTTRPSGQSAQIARLLPLSPYLENARGDRVYLSVARGSLEPAGCRLSERRCQELFGRGLTNTSIRMETIGGEVVDISTTDVDPRPGGRPAPSRTP